MPTAIFDGEVYEDGQQFKDDSRLMVRFFMQPIKHEVRSQEEGRPIFIDVAYIEVITPGSRDTLVTEATENYQRRFARQWENFKARQSTPLEGTLLSEIPWLTASQNAELNALNIKTVEQLVGMPDVLAQKVMGSFDLRARAQRFLDASKDAAATTKLEGQLADRDAKIAALEQQVAAILSAQEESKKQTNTMPPTTAAKKG